jgi:branched-chain amino acid transport system ATP-binding protein
VVVDEVFDVIGTVRDQGVSVLLVEQNAQMALDVSSRAYLLAEGRVAMEGRAEELANSQEVRDAVLGL